MTQPSVLAVIPARYGSTRFPGKPLVPLAGVPMILHVWRWVQPLVDRVIVATDDARIQQVVTDAGGEAWMTHPDHPSGTDRVWEVAAQCPEYPLVLNVQGDEPLIDPAHIRLLIERMATSKADVMTLVTPLTEDALFHDPNVVKAVLTPDGRALYFSRAPIPYAREAHYQPLRHLGLYLYRRQALAAITQCAPTPLEQTEKLEQLRLLEHGYRIDAAVVDDFGMGVDTPADLAKVEGLLAQF
jgi:3-deoxy-manno-octulosonate cytidylyltransferase (CMP-KDO synthetase)